MNIENFEILPSTQDYIKEKRALGEDLIVTAKAQTGGKGTKGRAFSSFEGGVYLSKLSFYENFPAKEAFKMMAGAAVAVCKTLEYFGLKPTIKWANDVFVNDKKICGILVENSINKNRFSSSIVGVGLNVNNDFPDELKDIAISMKQCLKRQVEIRAVEEKLLYELSTDHSMKEYVERVGYLNRKITLIYGDKRVPAYAVSVDESGALTVEEDGEIKRVVAAEVSLKLD